jgi:DNA polymerase I
VDNSLPFREIWAVDFEYYVTDGEQPRPLCLVAKELKSGRIIRLWRDEFGLFPPYRLDPEALFVAYAANAELACHIVLGWGQPARILDLHAEFRRIANDGSIKHREKDFFKLPSVLALYGLDTIGLSAKRDMIARILAGPPYSAQDRLDILDYCQSDVDALEHLLPRMLPQIGNLEHAFYRGRYLWPVAQMEVRGVPLDAVIFRQITHYWEEIKLDLINRIDADYGVFDGGSFNFQRFEQYCALEGINWPRHASGQLETKKETFREMARLYPKIEPLRELRSSLSELRLNKLAVGADGRNRAALMPFASKSSRNQPGSTSYVFGPAKWIRFLIRPQPGRVLVHRDYNQQEVFIAAVLSGDRGLLAACESGDVYLTMAKQFGFAPPDATKESHPAVRDLFKTVVLAIQYGMQARSLALRTGLSRFEASELLLRLQATYRRFWEFAEQVANEAGLFLKIQTPFGWQMRTPPGINPRTVRNFPMQASGAEILRAACIIGDRRGIELVAPVHDALMCEGPADCAEDVSQTLDKAMRDASGVVLRGYELKTEAQIITHQSRFFDKRGLKMWTEINRLIELLDATHG